MFFQCGKNLLESVLHNRWGAFRHCYSLERLLIDVHLKTILPLAENEKKYFCHEYF
ncbi:hypothetical protein D3C80_1921570 [compost metagenome]